MKKIILLYCLAGTMYYTGNVYAQEKRKIDLAVEVLSPVADSIYAISGEGQIPFIARVVNNGPDDLNYGDSLIYWSSITNGVLVVLMEDVPVGKTYPLYETSITVPGEVEGTAQFELCVHVAHNNELFSPAGSEETFTSSWIDEVEGNNMECTVFTIAKSTTEIKNFQESNAPISVYPIPVQTELNICIDDKSSGTYQMSIYSIEGREILHHTFTKNDSKEVLKTDVSRLPPGIYYLKLEHARQSFSTKLIIQ